jgi:hypothetical protein
MKAKKLFFKECHLAGRKYHDVDEVWNELKVGTVLKLVRDADNRYDVNAVEVVYERVCENCRGESEEFLLGYIPSGENDQIALLLDAGWDNIFECRINKITPDAHPEQQIRLTIRLNRRENIEHNKHL